MNLVTVLADRRAATSCQDPDTLHGILFSLETDAQRAANAPVIYRMLKNRQLLEKAREGAVGRVPAFAGNVFRSDVAIEFPDGLFPSRWKRETIAAMLRPDGVTTPALAVLLDQCGAVRLNTANAVHELRKELRVFSVDVEHQVVGGHVHLYRIIGQPAWRMQKIISNGWSV